MVVTPLQAMPAVIPALVPGSVKSNGSKGVLLSCALTGGTRTLLVIRYVCSDTGWRTHPVGPVVFDTAAALGAATDAQRFVRLVGDAADTSYHVLDQGGTGTLVAVSLLPVDFF